MTVDLIWFKFCTFDYYCESYSCNSIICLFLFCFFFIKLTEEWMKVASNAREEVLNEIEELSITWDAEREDFIEKLVKCRDKLNDGNVDKFHLFFLALLFCFIF